jgi:hypothetical protein
MKDNYNPSFKKYLLSLVDEDEDEADIDSKKKKKKRKSADRDKDLPFGILKYIQISNAANS